MKVFDFLKRKKEVDPAEARRAFLSKSGRICDGTIIESEINENGEEIVYYFYTVHGVDFESSEILTAEQRENPLKYAPGARIGVRFDPKNHGNSMLD
jgi:hypothetical protein